MSCRHCKGLGQIINMSAKRALSNLSSKGGIHSPKIYKGEKQLESGKELSSPAPGTESGQGNGQGGPPTNDQENNRSNSHYSGLLGLILKWIIPLLLLILLLFLLGRSCEKSDQAKTAKTTPPKIVKKEPPKIIKKRPPKKKRVGVPEYMINSGWIIDWAKDSTNSELISHSPRFQKFLKEKGNNLTMKDLSKEGIPKLCADYNGLGIKCYPKFFLERKGERDEWAKRIKQKLDLKVKTK